jgi:hypothetical protein
MWTGFALADYALQTEQSLMTGANQLNAIASFVRQDPLPVLGFMLIGTSGVPFFRLYKKLQLVGDKSYKRFILPLSIALAIHRAYLVHARQEGWSRWPAHLPWLCATVGSIALIVGMFRL